MILFVALWVAVLIETVLVIGLSQRLTAVESARPVTAQASTRSMGFVPVGAHIPRRTAERLGIRSANSAARSSVILFLSPGCAPCLKLAELLKGHDLGRTRPDDFELVVVTTQAGIELFNHIGRTVEDAEGILAQSLGVPGTPFGLAVDAGGIVRGAVIPNGTEDVATLVARAPSPADDIARVAT